MFKRPLPRAYLLAEPFYLLRAFSIEQGRLHCSLVSNLCAMLFPAYSLLVGKDAKHPPRYVEDLAILPIAAVL